MVEYSCSWIYDWTLSAITNNPTANLSEINEIFIDFSKKIAYLERPLVLVTASERKRKQLQVDLCSRMVPLFASLFKELMLTRIKSSSLYIRWLEDGEDADMDEHGHDSSMQLDFIASIMNHTHKFKTKAIMERDLVHLLQIAIQKQITSQIGFEESTLNKYIFFLKSKVSLIVQAFFGKDSSMPCLSCLVLLIFSFCAPRCDYKLDPQTRVLHLPDSSLSLDG